MGAAVNLKYIPNRFDVIRVFIKASVMVICLTRLIHLVTKCSIFFFAMKETIFNTNDLSF